MRIRVENMPAGLGANLQALKLCLEAFGQAVRVRQILLFGSFARGDSKPSSDVDLCIVADGAQSQLETARRLRRAIRNIRPKPAFTLIPITPERLAEKKRDGDHFFTTVLAEGVIVASED